MSTINHIDLSAYWYDTYELYSSTTSSTFSLKTDQSISSIPQLPFWLTLLYLQHTAAYRRGIVCRVQVLVQVHTTAFSFEHAYSTTMIQSLPNLLNPAAQAEMRVFADHLFDSCRAMSNNHVGERAGAYQHSMYQNHQNTTQQPKLSSLV